MANVKIDLAPWKPTPTEIPVEWMNLIQELADRARGSQYEYVLGVKYDAQGVGDLLRSWGLSFPVVMAGHLKAYDKQQLRATQFEGIEEVLNHFDTAEMYGRAIEDEKLPPLLTPPYEDLGALLIAVATYFRWLKSLYQQSNERAHTGHELWRIERVGNSLLNIGKRLGMWYFKREIEDALEQLRNPAIFQEDKQEYERILQQDRNALEEMQRVLAVTYREITGKPTVVIYTPCGVTGLKRRVQDAHTTTTSEKARLTGFDLVTYDVIVSTVQDCYAAFGALSQLGYIQDRVTDHNANPKNNGYSHIALGLIFNVDSPYLREHELQLGWAQVCQLQIATHLMQAIGCYGCLYPEYYNLYRKDGRDFDEINVPTGEQFWESQSGKVFQAIRETLISSITKPESGSPIIVFDKNHTSIALPINATVLDFAYTLGSEIGERTVEAIVNNRKAPLYRTLQAGDVIEIRVARQTQANEAWLYEVYATTQKAKHGIKESIDKNNRKRRGYELLQQELRRYHYMLSLEDLDEELRLLLKLAGLETLQTLLELLESEKETKYTPNWAAQEIMKQMGERKERVLVERGRAMWMPMIDTSIVQHKQGGYRQHLCGQCRPSYPRDSKILGRLRKRSGELVVHRDTCAHLIDRPLGRHSMLIPMTWQLQSPAFIVAFAVVVQDRKGIILDLARQLRRHECDLLTINAEATNPKTGIDHLYFTIEAHSEQEVIDIWNEIYKIENVTEVILDESRTPRQVCESLEKLRQQHGNLSTKTNIEFAWEEQISVLQPRPRVLLGPFDISRPAGGDMFFGRSEEIKLMQRELCDAEQGRAVILYGPRRSGKSSLCKHFLEHYMYEPCWGVSYSLQNDRNQPETVILMQLAEKVSSSFQAHFQQSAPVWEDFRDSDPQVRFKRLLQACLGQMPHSRLILVLDEFGGAIESKEKQVLEFRFFTFWREVMTEIPQLSLIIALPTSAHHTLSSKQFGSVFSFALPVQMDFLDVESAKRLLADPLRDLNIAVHPNTVALAVTLTGGNPYYLTLIGQRIVTYLNLNVNKQVISDKDLNQVVEKLIMENVSQNFDYLKAELLDREELTVLEKMVDFMSLSNQPEIQLKKIAWLSGMQAATARRYLDRMRMGLIL